MNAQKLAEVGALHLALSRRSLAYYLDAVVINSNPEPARFGEVAEGWQRQLYTPKIPMFEGLAGVQDYTGPWSFCDILARGHDKSSLEARLATWLLLASRRKIRGYIIAADGDQGELVLQALKDEADLNPWVSDQLSIKRGMVESDRGFFEVLPADSAGAWGLRGNCYIFDEWTNWNKRGQEMWRAVITGREKVQPAILGIVSNAGFLGSWQHAVYQSFPHNPDFTVWDKPGQLASWMPRDRVDALRAMIPESEGRRVYDNEWIDIGEQADYLTRDDVNRCVDPEMILRLRAQPKIRNYVIVVDYGPKRDRSAITVMHLDRSCIARVDRMDVKTGRLSVEGLETWLDQVIDAFPPACIVIDPYQMASTIEKLQRRRKYLVEAVDFRGGRTNQRMAMALRAAVVHQQIKWYAGCGALPNETLEDELARLVTVRKAYGFRFDHEATGHDDRAFTLGVGLLTLPRFPMV